MTPLQSLAADLVNLAGDVARAVFGARAPEHSTVFYHSPDCIHGKAAEILDAWLCTVHWWAWKAIDSPIRTRPHVVFGGSAIAADRRDQAVVEKMSFSALDCDIFTATAATIDLFLRFLDLPPDLVWPADYPPVPKPQEPAPDAESAKPQAPAEARPTGADGKTADLAEAESVEAPPARDGKAPAGGRQRKQPPDIALAAYRIEMATGMNQTDIAAKLQAEFRKPVSQGQVSRWIRAVKKFLKDGNVLPSIEPMIQKPKSFDPSVLEMGRRQDGRAVRQRDRRDPDSTEDRD